MKTIKAFTSLLAAATLALSACGASDSAAVVVGASPVPHAQILKYVKENLAKNGIITLPKDKKATIYNVEKNPKNITFKPAGAPSIPKILPDVDIAIINGNYALENGLKPSKDAIYLESGEGNPYANILAWNSAASGKKAASIKKLDELLHSPQVAAYIKKTWPNGEVIPAF